MINILNIIDDVGEEFSSTIPSNEIFLSLIVALISSVIINFIYKKTFSGVTYSKTFALSLLLLALVTSIIIKTINSNLSLSLGMVGALSIVRFRTSVKDPLDTIFMFWAISSGIMSGAGLYLVTILSTLLIGLIYFISYTINSKKDNKKLIVINTNKNNSEEIIKLLQSKKCLLKTESYNNDLAELSFEAKNRKILEDVIKDKDKYEIISLNIIDVA